MVGLKCWLFVFFGYFVEGVCEIIVVIMRVIVEEDVVVVELMRDVVLWDGVLLCYFVYVFFLFVGEWRDVS